VSASELLIVDGAERYRKGLRAYFDGRGYVCTAVQTAEEAQRLVTRKLFPAALVDLNVNGPGLGPELIRFIKLHSEPTSVVLITDERSFEGAVEAIRAGAMDVVQKTPDQLEQLALAVRRATERYESSNGSGEIFRQVRSVLDESFKVILEQARHIYPAGGGGGDGEKPDILIVDGEPNFLQELAWLTEDLDWNLHSEMSGGGALDKSMSTTLDIVASRAELMDLRGSMVVRSIQAQSPKTVGLVYSDEGEGKLETYEDGQLTESESSFVGSERLLERIVEVLEKRSESGRDRKLIQAVSADHRAFIRRYAELKQKIERLISE